MTPADTPSTARNGAAAGDGRDGVHDEVDLFGWPEQLLGCRHTPSSGARAGVVVCLPPFDAAVDHGRAMRLGRRLARHGVAVQRFHHRGSALSDGDPAAVSFTTLVADVGRAVELLADRTGVERIGLVGARLGALVAARVGRDRPGAPIVLWEPVVDPRHVVEQAAGARARTRTPVRGAPHVTAFADTSFADVAQGVVAPPPPPPPAGGAVPAGGPVAAAVNGSADEPAGPLPPPPAERPYDIFDTQLCLDLVDGGAVDPLADELGSRPGSLLVVQTGQPTTEPDGLRPAYRSLADECRARRVAVDVACHPCDGWRDGELVPAGPPDALVEATAVWLAAHLLADRPA